MNINDGELTRLSSLVRQLREAQAKQAELEAELDRTKDLIAELSENAIPTLMDGWEIERIRTADGVDVIVKDDLKHHVAEERKDAAYEWLERAGHGGIVRREVVVAFNKGQEAEAMALESRLAGEFSATKQRRDVNWQTLNALLKKLLADGTNVPVDLFGVHVRRVTNLKGGSKNE